jgi:hypothetical protein
VFQIFRCLRLHYTGSCRKYGPALYDLKPVLSGYSSSSLQRWLKKQPDPNSSGSSSSQNAASELAKKYYSIYSFFSGANGCLDVWEAVIHLLSKRRNLRAVRERMDPSYDADDMEDEGQLNWEANEDDVNAFCRDKSLRCVFSADEVEK